MNFANKDEFFNWYGKYLKSKHWLRFRRKVLLVKGFRCEQCSRRREPHRLQVDHKHYRTLGREQIKDVNLLCTPCHERKTERRRWAARLDGWASKVYGEDWIAYCDIEKVEAEFILWLKKTGE